MIITKKDETMLGLGIYKNGKVRIAIWAVKTV